MAYLVLQNDGNSGPRFVLEKSSVTIGRSASCDIHLEDPSVSFEHAELRVKESVEQQKSICLVDRNSTNGTFVNSDRIESRHLAHDDIINVGLSNFRFVDEELDVLGDTQTIKKTWIPGVFYLTDKSA